MTGASVINLSVVGGGVRVSRLVFDYFLAGHQASTLVYVVDSFAFYSKQWNEERLQDTRLFLRAPFDPPLASLLLGNPVTRAMAFDYVTGFSKINNRDRFAADVTPEESTRFNRAYRPVRQIDEQRLEYLYPKTIDAAAFDGYLAQFESLIQLAQTRNMRVIVVKPPIPERVARQIPAEDRFDARLKEILERHRVEFHDFTHVGNEEKLFYDTDHLNREGVLNFFEHSLAPDSQRQEVAAAAATARRGLGGDVTRATVARTSGFLLATGGCGDRRRSAPSSRSCGHCAAP